MEPAPGKRQHGHAGGGYVVGGEVAADLADAIGTCLPEGSAVPHDVGPALVTFRTYARRPASGR